MASSSIEKNSPAMKDNDDRKKKISTKVDEEIPENRCTGPTLAMEKKRRKATATTILFAIIRFVLIAIIFQHSS